MQVLVSVLVAAFDTSPADKHRRQSLSLHFLSTILVY